MIPVVVGQPQGVGHRGQRSAADGSVSRPCSSRVRYSTLTPASVSQPPPRRRPGVRRRGPLSASPTSAGVTRLPPATPGERTRAHRSRSTRHQSCQPTPAVAAWPPHSQGRPAPRHDPAFLCGPRPQAGRHDDFPDHDSSADPLTLPTRPPAEWAARRRTTRPSASRSAASALSKVRGRFGDLSDVDVVVGSTRRRPSHLDATIALASIDTGNADRDGHLRSADLLDVERRPTMTYRSTTSAPTVPTGSSTAS